MNDAVSHDYWLTVFNTGLAAVEPAVCLPSTLPAAEKYNKINVIAAGKAAASMASAAFDFYRGANISGLVVCPEGYKLPCGPLQVIEAGHPLPNDASQVAAEEALAIARQAGPGELCLLLVSGGASALLAAPVVGLSLEEKISISNRLLRSGATIREINTVRKAQSRIKGGKLLEAISHDVSLCVRLISDVVGDDPRVIGSGLGCYDDISPEAAAGILKRHDIDFNKNVLKQYVKPEKRLDTDLEVIANATRMLDTVSSLFETRGYSVVRLGSDITGEAKDVARKHAHDIEKYIKNLPDSPLAFISGGELTVTVTGSGKGGPNQEYLLSLMINLHAGPFAGLAADTDGRDGNGGAGGAWFNAEHHARIQQDKAAVVALKKNDSYIYFNSIGCLFNPKPTLNNVNDLRVILYHPKGF